MALAELLLPGPSCLRLAQLAAGNGLLAPLFGRNPVEAIRALARAYGSLTRSLPDALAGLAYTDLILSQPSFLFGGDLARKAAGQIDIKKIKPLLRQVCWA